MKKMNRSQSSYRQCKTLLNEDDSDTWANKYANRHNNSRNNLNIANSFIDANKENNSLYQSISERNFDTKSREKVTEFNPGQQVLLKLEDKCRRQEEELRRLYEQREEQLRTSTTSNPTRGYNYSEKYYQSEIETLKSILRQKEKELDYYKQEYSSKNEEMDSISSEISCKIERDQRDKNLYIKEINHKTIEISHLQERVKIHKAEIETLKMYINEKDQTIREYQDKIGQADMKKKKIQFYQAQLKESNEFLRQLEISTQKLKEDTDKKDHMIAQKGKVISELQQTIGSYEDKLRSIESSLLCISQDKKAMIEKNEDLMRQCENWRKSYEELLLKTEQIQEFEIKIKTYQGMLEDSNRRNMELTSMNQKYKITIASYEKSAAKHQQMEKENGNLKRQLKDRDEKLMEFQAREKDYRHLDDCYTKLRKEKDQNFVKMQEKIKENKSLNLQLQESRAIIGSLEEELAEIQSNNNRIKDRGEKMDYLMKENNKLNTLVLEKVSQIEKLQIKLNSMQNKISQKNNENLKLKNIINDKDQQISQITVQVQDLRQRYEIETSNRMMSEDKVTRCNQQIMAQRNIIDKLEIELKQNEIKMQELKDNHQVQFNQLQQKLAEIENDKKETTGLLVHSKQQIQDLRKEIIEYKRQFEQVVGREREHRIQMKKLQKGLEEYTDKVYLLQAEKMQMIQKSQQLVAIHQFFNKFKQASQKM